jgi:uncharacterized membrane protein required for colicin V production
MPTLLKEIGWIDALAFGALAFLIILGFVRGCSGEVGRLVAVCSAAALGFFGFAPVSRLVLGARLFHDNAYAGRLVTFILLFVVCVALWLGLSKLLSEIIRLVVPQPFDAILGGVIGGVKAFVLVSVLCTFGLLNPDEKERAAFKDRSVAAQFLSPHLKRITSPEAE